MKNVTFIFIWSCCTIVAYANGLPDFCKQDCVVGFGAPLGKSFAGVKAYSNCNNACVNPEPNFIAGIYTGIKWQCVEYARRWLLLNEGVVYGDVDIAADIWNLEYVYTPDKSKRFSLQSIVNGSQNANLQRGDMLIYSSAFYGTGHIAVVLHVDKQKQVVNVGEQNFKNSAWQKEYAREISYITRNNATWLLDAYVIGWKRVTY